ncbi:MAG: hypothetical protein M3Z68_12665 [Acinetobacter baumannii]|nr:hypothetical protein [Acinetobacter baumannii]MCT6938047.1 hypothetical protein [Acinetobacter baumannii]
MFKFPDPPLFNTVGTYLAMATIVLIIMVIFFYIIEPK